MKNVILNSALAMALATAAFAQQSEVGKRAENQQDRIAQGVKAGTLTPHQTAKIENKEAKVNREVRTDRKANGGRLTSAEKKQVNHQQNKLSKKIYKDKHS